MNFNMNPPTTNTSKYKTMLCKHFETKMGCAFKDKCQFAHGYAELRNQSGLTGSTTTGNVMKGSQPTTEVKKGPNLQNYKIVKCKYWEKDGTCRYGSLCTFAHGDMDMRTKTDNLLLTQGYYEPGQGGQPGMPSTQFVPGMGGMGGMGMGLPPFDPNFPMMNPYMMGFDPNLMLSGGMGMMGMPQGFDPNLAMTNPMLMNFPQMPFPDPKNQGTGNSFSTNIEK